MTTVIGIDPGIVHTGAVAIHFFPELRELTVDYEVVLGVNVEDLHDWLAKLPQSDAIYVEDYDPRRNFNLDNRMVASVTRLRDSFSEATFLDNAGVSTIIRPEVMKLLGVWRFKQSTHHQDLRSAARILLYGMLRDKEKPTLKLLLNSVVRGHVEGHPWKVTVNE